MELFLSFSLVALLCVSEGKVNEIPIATDNVVSLQGGMQLALSLSRTQMMTVDHLTQPQEGRTRHKRSLQDLLAAYCINRCAKKMMMSMENLGLLETEQSGAVVNPALYDPDTFDSYCDTGLAAKSCIFECAEMASPAVKDEVVGVMKTSFAGIDYICIDHKQDFKDSLPCYERAEESVKETCRPKCGDVKSISRSLEKDMNTAAARRDLNRLSKIIHKLCDLVHCQVKCNSKVMTRVCSDSKPARILNGFIQTAMRSMEELLKKTPDAIKFWPTSCRRMGNIEQTPKVNETPKDDDPFDPDTFMF
jgi:hypothetical protein